MNKKVKDLLKEATTYVHERINEGTSLEEQYSMIMERLVELAVNDCANIADKNCKLGVPLGAVMKQYFGFVK